ncbi:MAG TPA: GNAT family N-acetyltransferase [Aliiroseovarius sp.]|nr:GNAT family N-acetyltransferase [Aliiroseovarius sp.]
MNDVRQGFSVQPQVFEQVFEKGRYIARQARDDATIAAAVALRYRAFVDPQGDGQDRDRFDDLCDHVVVEAADTGAVVACYRLMHIPDGRAISQSYSAQFYDLSALNAYRQPMVEMGRFCVAPGLRDPDILRISWAMMTRFVDRHGIGLMFGCTSFAGTNPAPYRAAFDLLRQKHLAPPAMRPRQKAPEIFRFADRKGPRADAAAGQAVMPPLLKTYMAMGGWVSDHAVIDRDLNTMHVFTGLEVAAVPPARARILRRDAR